MWHESRDLQCAFARKGIARGFEKEAKESGCYARHVTPEPPPNHGKQRRVVSAGQHQRIHLLERLKNTADFAFHLFTLKLPLLHECRQRLGRALQDLKPMRLQQTRVYAAFHRPVATNDSYYTRAHLGAVRVGV